MHPLVAAESPRAPHMIRLLVMTTGQRDAILRHVWEALPNEGVALLAVQEVAADGRAVVARIFPGTNIDASPYRFTMDPVEVVMADRAMREQGWTLGAIVHSHVASPATPSATDMREAFYPAALLLIVSLAGHEVGRMPEFGAWRIDHVDGERLVMPVPIQVLTEEPGR